MAKAIKEALVLSRAADWSPDAGPGVLLDELLGIVADGPVVGGESVTLTVT